MLSHRKSKAIETISFAVYGGLRYVATESSRLKLPKALVIANFLYFRQSFK